MLLRDMYYQFLTTHLHQISRLTDMVESLQSQIMQLVAAKLVQQEEVRASRKQKRIKQ
jgi:hypothetical protein